MDIKLKYARAIEKNSYLIAENKSLKSELSAAIADIYTACINDNHMPCAVCSYFGVDFQQCIDCYKYESKFKWRGIKK